MVKLFRDTVTLSDLWVTSNDRPSDFYASSWQRGETPVPTLVVRILLAAAAIGTLIWSVVEGPTPYFLIYLTNWGLILVSMMTLSSLLVSCKSRYRKHFDATVLPWYFSMYWFLFNITVPVAVLITALYWILLYNPEIAAERGIKLFWFDVATHGFNSCVVVAELMVSRTPLRFLHFYQPLAMGLWYAAFTAIYYAAGGTNANGEPFIYDILDWRNGRQAGSIVGIAIVGVIAIYTVLWALALCRNKLSTSFVRTTSHDLPPTPPDDIMHTRIV